uniref:Uncharacterized protein n=1 Tax=Candidatus Kentrum sp. LPFa TaxID=2126335 RepID=A0A450X6I2_9GAMM|nr:MAG: hypothetical protein BECKLPF1236A_GA0070988_104412 [Candidatus Kentron sp. LPFa]
MEPKIRPYCKFLGKKLGETQPTLTTHLRLAESFTPLTSWRALTDSSAKLPKIARSFPMTKRSKNYFSLKIF